MQWLRRINYLIRPLTFTYFVSELICAALLSFMTASQVLQVTLHCEGKAKV